MEYRMCVAAATPRTGWRVILKLPPDVPHTPPSIVPASSLYHLSLTPYNTLHSFLFLALPCLCCLTHFVSLLLHIQTSPYPRPTAVFTPPTPYNPSRTLPPSTFLAIISGSGWVKGTDSQPVTYSPQVNIAVTILPSAKVNEEVMFRIDRYKQTKQMIIKKLKY